MQDEANLFCGEYGCAIYRDNDYMRALKARELQTTVGHPSTPDFNVIVINIEKDSELNLLK